MPVGVTERFRGAAGAVPASFARCVAATFGTRLLGIAIGVVNLTVTTRLLGPEGRGRFGVTMAALATILQFGNAGLHSSATYWLAQDPARRTSVGQLLAWFSFGPVALLCGAALLAVWNWPQLLPDVPLSNIAFAVLAGPPSMFLLLAGNAFLGLGRAGTFNGLDLASKLAGACAVLLLLWSDLTAVFAAYAALHFALAAFAYTQLVGAELPGRPDWTIAREMAAFARRVFVVNLSMFLVTRVDLFLLNALAGTAQAGLYSVAVQIGEILMLTTASVAAILFPRLAAMEVEQRWHATMRVVRVSAAILALMALGLAAIARPLFERWFGPDFVGSTIALYWLLPGLWCLGMNALLHQYLAAFGMPRFLVFSTMAGAALSAVLNLWAIPRYGLAGAAAATSLTYMVLLASTVTYLNTSTGKAFRA